MKKDKKKKTKRKKSFNIFNWKNINIGFKYLFAFLVTITLFLIATIVVYIQLDIVKKDVDTFINHNELSNDLAQIALIIERKDSYVSNFIILKNTGIIEQYEQSSDELNELLDKVEPYFHNKYNEIEFTRIRENSADIDDLFLSTIADKNMEHNRQLGAQIQVDTKKTSSVTLINRLIEEVTAEQNSVVSRTNNSLNKSTIYLAAANILAIILGSVIMFLISRSISGNLHNVVHMTSTLAQGNLAVQSIKYDGQDEIGKLASAVNRLKKNMHNILTEVTHASHSVTSRSQQLTQSAKEVQLGSEQIAVTMDELATGAETQANSATHLSENMQQFVDSIIDSQHEGQVVADSSKNALAITADGAKLMEQSISQMERIDMIVADAVTKVRSLDEQSEAIFHLVAVVKDIADQTNLLSLNAAIEAARAGEHGQGFAVVANEVRKLAEQVTNSVTEITNIVNNIQTETSLVVDSLNEGYKEVEEGIVQISKTGENFSVIDESITEMSERIATIATRLNHVAQSSEEMNGLIEDIAAVSEEAAAGVEQSAASTQEATSAMNEVTRNANELDDLAQLLNKEIERFKL